MIPGPVPQFDPAVNKNDPSTVIAEVKGRLQSIAAISGSAFKGPSIFVYDDANLADRVKGNFIWPAAGIIYEGMRAVGEPGKATDKIGMSAEIVVSIALVTLVELYATADGKTPVILALSQIRGSMMASRSVTGHRWRFLVEAPASKKDGLAFWIQRWSVPIQLPPGQ